MGRIKTGLGRKTGLGTGKACLNWGPRRDRELGRKTGLGSIKSGLGRNKKGLGRMKTGLDRKAALGTENTGKKNLGSTG